MDFEALAADSAVVLISDWGVLVTVVSSVLLELVGNVGSFDSTHCHLSKKPKN